MQELAIKNTNDIRPYQHLRGAKRWATFSTFDRCEEEIEFELLHNYEDVCIVYLLEFAHMTPEFLEKLIVLSTGLVNHRNADYNMQAVKEILEYNYEYGTSHPTQFKIQDEYGKLTTISSDEVSDRMHWGELSRNQNISVEFAKKYGRLLDLGELKLREDVDPEIISIVEQGRAFKDERDFLDKNSVNNMDIIKKSKIKDRMSGKTSDLYARINRLKVKD